VITFVVSASPPVEKIAFSCEAERPVDEQLRAPTVIFTMNADGSDVVQRTTAEGLDENPAWSPDGSRVVFESTRGGRQRTLFVMNADGSELRPLLPSRTDEDCAVNDRCRARWSPDGKRIAFSSDRFRHHGRIHVVNADGSGLRLLVRGAEDENSWEVDTEPSWSPDGRQIVFRHHWSGANKRLDIVDVDQPDNRRPLVARFTGNWVSLSPDGKRLLYLEWQPEAEEIHVMNVDGSGDRRLTPSGEKFNIFTGPYWPDEPAWSPDGRRIVYSRHSGGSDRMDLWVMDADGSNKKQLLKGRFKQSYALGAAWVRPVSR
jgi:Tol biopolymer transport system component